MRKVAGDGLIGHEKGAFVMAAQMKYPAHPRLYLSQHLPPSRGKLREVRADYMDAAHFYGGKIVRLPGLDTVKPDHTFDESKPTKDILKASVDRPAS
ncbi:hypothetical protein [Kitasatospora sp. NPDC094016]|uniref:hypothetical protein n=1 Tax=Kitasatospora sp. NPDC094016 TaxID=3154986 RepID=UPI003333932E